MRTLTIPFNAWISIFYTTYYPSISMPELYSMRQYIEIF